MKNIIPFIVSSAILVSCSGNSGNTFESALNSNDLNILRTEKTKLESEQQAISEKMRQINDLIESLDTLKKIPLITTFKVKDTVFNHYLELQGNVKTKQNLLIYPEYSGILTQVYVKEGQAVRKGQTLAKIDDGGLGQQLAQLEIQADLAKTTFERQKRLWEQNIGSEIQYLQAKSNYEAQQKAIDQLKQQIAKTYVKAPFSGTIDDVITEQGSVVVPGQSPLMRIVNLNDMYIETDVPESYITNVKPGRDVLVNFPVLGTTYNAKIRQSGNFINPANRTFKIEIAVPNKDNTIKPNLTAKLKINDYTSTNALLVPLSIISENAEGQQYIYVVMDINANMEGIAERVIIETGLAQNDMVEVISGIENGAQIIKEGARSVKDGQTVSIIQQ
ncbi:MAG: efflux RND transporter periplasmic adaptor subunit [Flavobacteriaceae bacterium]|nr:efflux RND transporter periplasmic adaptor subunit [Bacteroidia bacterium]NNK88690.1 efflux RND transporter periplasmic adaptor subunit [Flavobacteriaceae bacterium]